MLIMCVCLSENHSRAPDAGRSSCTTRGVAAAAECRRSSSRPSRRNATYATYAKKTKAETPRVIQNETIASRCGLSLLSTMLPLSLLALDPDHAMRCSMRCWCRTRDRGHRDRP